MDKTGSQGSQEKLKRQILRYLIEHPEAKDTVEGVMQWWVYENATEHRREDIKDALQWLVAKGWVTERPPAHSLFGLNHEHITEIQRFLEETEI